MINRPEGMLKGSGVSAKGPREEMAVTSPEAWQFRTATNLNLFINPFKKKKNMSGSPKNFSGSLTVL